MKQAEMEEKVEKAEAKVSKAKAEIKAERKETAKAVRFSADLKMVRINKQGVVYEVLNPTGFKVKNLNYLEIARSEFPADDNFSMDFIDKDLAAAARTGDKDAADGVAVLLKKQNAFRQFKNLKLYISAE